MIRLDEFNAYVESFHKEPGNYNQEEILNIGVKFKQLPIKMRNWNQLANKLGVNYSGNALRKRIEKHLKQNPELLDNTTQGEVYVNDYVEQQKVRDWYNAFRRNIREEVRIENLKDEIIRAANKFKSLKSPGFNDEPFTVDFVEGQTEAVLLLSDLHIGVDCDNYVNVYNADIAATRLGILAANVVNYCKRNHVYQLNVLNLGDMIQGLIHTNARIEQQMDVAEQIIIASELIANFLNKIQEAASIITYRSVFDNHSRAIANKEEHIEKEQFSRLIDWFIKERLKDSSIQFIEDNIDGGIGRFKLNNGKTLMFAHGHQDSINQSWQNFIGVSKDWVDYICLAHYHNPKEKAYNRSVVFVNGSIVGCESYSFGRRLFGDPVQKLLIFNSTNTHQDINIYLN